MENQELDGALPWRPVNCTRAMRASHKQKGRRAPALFYSLLRSDLLLAEH
jgi:hypothetical protein